MNIPIGQASNIDYVFIQDSSSTTGAGLTGITSGSSGLAGRYIYPGGTSVALTFETITTLGTYQAPTSNAYLRIKELDATNHPGVYEIHYHNDWFSTANARKAAILTIRGVTNMAQLNHKVTIDYALQPATAARTLVVDANGLADANTVKVGPTGSGTAQTARDIGASVLLSSGTGTGQLDFTSGVVKANLAQILGTALTETAGQIAAGFKKFFNIATPAATMDHGILVDTVTTTTTATNLTNAPTSGDLTATMKTSVQTAATASIVAFFGADAATFIASIWNALTSGMSTVGSIGKKLADWVVGTIDTYTGNTKQTGDAYAIVNNGTYGNSALNTDLDALLARLTAPRAGYLDNLSGGAVALASALATLQTSVDDLPTNAELATALASADDAVLAAIAALNNLSQAQVRAALGMASANLDTQLDALPTNAELATALGTADDAVLAAIAALNNLSSAQAQSAAAAALTAYDPPTRAEATSDKDAVIAAIPTVAQVADGVWDEATAGHQTAGTTGKALTDAGSGGSLTVQDIVDGVWDEPIADHLDAGSTGAKLNAAASAGDPWSTPLPGSYAAGEAGYIIGNNIDAQMSDLLGQTPDPIIVGNSDDCADVQVFDAGERKPIGGRLDITSGTFTISGVLCYMADADGAVVYGVNGLAATGYDTGSQTSPSFWYDLNTASPPSAVAMAIGTYDFWFKVTGTTSEGLTRVHEVHIVVQVV